MKYRFKTENEFKNEYGENWRSRRTTFNLFWNIRGEMDYLFGLDIPLKLTFNGNKHEPICYIDNLNNFSYHRTNNNRWSIYINMITYNNIIPDYKPKDIKRTL